MIGDHDVKGLPGGDFRQRFLAISGICHLRRWTAQNQGQQLGHGALVLNSQNPQMIVHIALHQEARVRPPLVPGTAG